MRKILLSILGIVLIVLAVGGAAVLINSKNTQKPKPDKIVKTVFTDKVANGTVAIVVPANGNVVAKRRVELYSEVQGVFKNSGKLFKVGESYKSGEIIIRIDAA